MGKTCTPRTVTLTMGDETFVIDVTLLEPGGEIFCFCPYDVEADVVVIGMNYLSHEPPPGCKRVVGLIHTHGEAELDRWIDNNSNYYRSLVERFSDWNKRMEDADA